MLPEMKLPGSREPSKKGEILSARKLKNMVPTWKLTRRIWPIGIIWVSPREKTNLRKSWKKEKEQEILEGILTCRKEEILPLQSCLILCVCVVVVSADDSAGNNPSLSSS